MPLANLSTSAGHLSDLSGLVYELDELPISIACHYDRWFDRPIGQLESNDNDFLIHTN